MSLRDPLERFWYERLSRDRRRHLTGLYHRIDWKFLAAVLVLIACTVALAIYLEQ